MTGGGAVSSESPSHPDTSMMKTASSATPATVRRHRPCPPPSQSARRLTARETGHNPPRAIWTGKHWPPARTRCGSPRKDQPDSAQLLQQPARPDHLGAELDTRRRSSRSLVTTVTDCPAATAARATTSTTASSPDPAACTTRTAHVLTGLRRRHGPHPRRPAPRRSKPAASTCSYSRRVAPARSRHQPSGREPDDVGDVDDDEVAQSSPFGRTTILTCRSAGSGASESSAWSRSTCPVTSASRSTSPLAARAIAAGQVLA